MAISNEYAEHVEEVKIDTYIVKSYQGFQLALNDFTYELYAQDAKNHLSHAPNGFPCLVHFNFLEMPYPQIYVFIMPIRDLKPIVEKFG